jgi:hypothetical protein
VLYVLIHVLNVPMETMPDANYFLRCGLRDGLRYVDIYSTEYQSATVGSEERRNKYGRGSQQIQAIL